MQNDGCAEFDTIKLFSHSFAGKEKKPCVEHGTRTDKQHFVTSQLVSKTNNSLLINYIRVKHVQT